MTCSGSGEQLKPVTSSAVKPVSWWSCYEGDIRGLSSTAKTVLENDSRYIAERGVLGAGAAGDERWPDNQMRSGLVMGAVQSGKTASMLGVAAKSLDSGVDVVVVLAGTRVALWRQTYERLMDQLITPAAGASGLPPLLLAPAPSLVHGLDKYGASPASLYQVGSARVRRAVREGSPIVMVVMKHARHLHEAASVLHQKVYSAHPGPVHVLVLDDEADDGSILDAQVERSLDPSVDALKQIPRHVADLWSRRGPSGPAAVPQVFATYVAYTATPQANLLQSGQNPLAPQDFMVALRTASRLGELVPRSTTYREPAGLSGVYTGGEVFYGGAGGGLPLVVPRATEVGDDGAAPSRDEQIGDAARAYLVAAAVRLWRDPAARRYSALDPLGFDTEQDARAASPAAHTMLFHPAATIESHFSAAADLLAWGNGVGIDVARSAIDSGARTFDSDNLARQLDEDDEPWRRWLESYRASATATAEAFELAHPPQVPDDEQWDAVKQLLVAEVFPKARFSIVNSDVDADDRPSFQPTLDEDTGRWHPAGDLLTIFVSGNVMARGLTLDGLTTTLFLRASGDPAADTQSQMQRWFGYRGSYIELCRVFLQDVQLMLFQQYHEADEALREQLVQGMNDSDGLPAGPTVIEGLRHRATAKIASLAKVPLCPGPRPFVDVVNSGVQPDPNMKVLQQLFAEQSFDVVAGVSRGRALRRKLSLREAATLLESLTYDDYQPDPSDHLATRWTDLGAQLRLGDSSVEPLLPLFRIPPAEAGTPGSPVAPRRCPYTIAAYFRLWDACLTRAVRGLFPTDDGSRPWSSLDLTERLKHQPRFAVGIRSGSVDQEEAGSTLAGFPFPVRPMRRKINQGVIKSTWGTRGTVDRGSSYLGDQLFDHASHNDVIPPGEGAAGWRAPGEDGLILFYVAKAEDRAFPVVAAGIVLPLGGPDHFAARATW